MYSVEVCSYTALPNHEVYLYVLGSAKFAYHCFQYVGPERSATQGRVEGMYKSFQRK